nr:unnamed protein product [Naegleria fowleri]
MSQPPFSFEHGKEEEHDFKVNTSRSSSTTFINEDITEKEFSKSSRSQTFEIYDQLLMVCEQTGPIFEIGLDENNDDEDIECRYHQNTSDSCVEMQDHDDQVTDLKEMNVEELFENNQALNTQQSDEIQNVSSNEMESTSPISLREDEWIPIRIQLNSLQQQVSDYQTEMNGVKEQVQNHKQTCQELSSTILSAIQKIEIVIVFHEEMKRMKNSMAELKASLQTLGNEQATFNTQLETTCLKVESLSNSLKFIQEDISPHDNEISKDMTIKLNILIQEKDELLKQLQQLKDENSQQYETLKMVQENVLQTKNVTEESISNIQSELQLTKHEMNSQIESFQKEIHSNKENMMELRESLNTCQKESSYAIDHDTLLQFQTLQKDHGELRTFTQRLEQELKESNRQIAQLKLFIMIMLAILVVLMAIPVMRVVVNNRDILNLGHPWI